MMENITRLVPTRRRFLVEKEIKALASLILDARDHYAVLGVHLNATLEEINRAYCHAVSTFHPLNQRKVTGADTTLHWILSRTFTRLSEAYRVLSNAQRRMLYDRTLKAELRDNVNPAAATLPPQAATPIVEE